MRRPQLRDYFIEFPEHDVAREAYADALEDYIDYCEDVIDDLKYDFMETNNE